MHIDLYELLKENMRIVTYRGHDGGSVVELQIRRSPDHEWEEIGSSDVLMPGED